MRKVNDFYDFFSHTFAIPGELKTEVGESISAKAINTLGEPMDSPWWVRRHYYDRMSIPQLVAGVGDSHPPAPGKWTITQAKREGVTPGFFIEDSTGTTFVLKFDPLDYPEMATGADIVAAKFFHALGYNVPEYYVVYFQPDRLELREKVMFINEYGKERAMEWNDVLVLLEGAPQDEQGRYRAIASRWLEGEPLGPFRFYGTRSDDPNDIVPHEHRRDLRGYRVFCAWLHHDDSRSANTLDMLLEEDGLSFIKHYLIDFGSTFGSGTFRPNSPRQGSSYLWDRKEAIKQFVSLGIWLPRWAFKKYPGIPAIGAFESKVFDPVTWVPEYPNPAFVNANPDDEFWAAKQVMALTREEIRAIVETAEYSDQRATDYLTETLIERQQKIGRDFFAMVLPLDRFEVREGQLVFDDLEIEHGFIDRRDYKVQWSHFNNDTEEKSPISGAKGFTIPPFGNGGYLSAHIGAERPGQTVTVYLRKQAGKAEVVGIDRTW